MANYSLDKGYSINGKPIVLCGANDNYYDIIQYKALALTESRLPQTENEVTLTESAQEVSCEVGDEVALETPNGLQTYTVAGFVKTTALLTEENAFGALLTLDGFVAAVPDGELTVYIQFKEHGAHTDAKDHCGN